MSETRTEAAESDATLDREAQLILAAKEQGTLATFLTYSRLSGPGWLQGAITLGGGSLAGSLYLGVIVGYEMMWLQPIAMVLGVVMLSAISYVTLSTGKKPFGVINEHISPLLGWGWLIATLMANIVWCLPQFALGTAAVTQNLLPGLEGTSGKAVVAISLLVVAYTVVWFYNSGSWGIKLFEIILKIMVGIVVLSFFGVVAAMTTQGALPWSDILTGLIPNLSYLFNPVPSMEANISQAGEFAEFWTAETTNMQKGRIITAFATAVGINMTFLLPYSMLRKGWNQTHRGLAIFDLSIGLIVPFVLATSCVVIAAASQFHGKSDDVFAMIDEGKTSAKEIKEYNGLFTKRLVAEQGDSVAEMSDEEKAAALTELPLADRKIAAMLAGPDNLALAKTLAPLVGEEISQKLFGIGVLGMALSTIIILMLINGFTICELVGADPKGPVHRLGSAIPAVGVLGPFVWGAAAPALATPTSIIGGAMLPIAYFSFFLLMNSRAVLGDALPTGTKRIAINVIMLIATCTAGFASAWGLLGRSMFGFPLGNVAFGALVILLLLGLISFLSKHRK